MTDLISRAVAIKAFTGKPPEYYHTSYIVGELNDIPAVDAVPVVRCKECESWNYHECVADGNCWCDKLEKFTWKNFFCADGERRCDA